MAYQVLARKWRPQDFSAVIGQEPIVTALRNALTDGRIAQAYLFSGIRGVGKTSVARILAKALNCERGPAGDPCNECGVCKEITGGSDFDVLEVDAATYSKVEQVRELTESLKYQPARDRYKVVIVDEIHRLSRQAFDALLKIVEEPPPYLIFIFATTESEAVPATILSRCQEYRFRRVPAEVLARHLGDLAAREEIEVGEAALGLIARAGDGSVRDSVALLDQLATFGSGKISDEEAARVLGGVDHDIFRRLIGAILGGDASGVTEIVAAVEAEGWDPRHVFSEFLAYCRDALHLSLGGAASALPGEAAAALGEEIAGTGYENLLRLLNQLLASESAVRRSETGALALEIAWLRAAELPKLVRVEELLAGGGADSGGANSSAGDSGAGNSGPGGSSSGGGGRARSSSTKARDPARGAKASAEKPAAAAAKRSTRASGERKRRAAPAPTEPTNDDSPPKPTPRSRAETSPAGREPDAGSPNEGDPESTAPNAATSKPSEPEDSGSDASAASTAEAEASGAGTAEPSAAESGATETGAAKTGTAEKGSAKTGATQSGAAQSSTAESGAAETKAAAAAAPAQTKATPSSEPRSGGASQRTGRTSGSDIPLPEPPPDMDHETDHEMDHDVEAGGAPGREPDAATGRASAPATADRAPASPPAAAPGPDADRGRAQSKVPAGGGGGVARFLERVSVRKQLLAAHLGESQRMVWREGTLEIHSVEGDDWLTRERLERESNRRVIERALTEVWGEAARWKLVCLPPEPQAEVEPEDPPSAEAEAHPRVQAVLDIFDGTVETARPDPSPGD